MGGYQSGAAGALADFVTGKAKEIHDRAMADENAQRDIEANVYREAIKSGNLNADQQKAAIDSLKKLYPHKDSKGIFDKLHEVLMHHKNVQGHVDAASAGAGAGAGATPPFLSPEQAKAATAATQTVQPTGATPSGQALPQPTGTAPSGVPVNAPANVPPAMRPPGSEGGGSPTPAPAPAPVTSTAQPSAKPPFSVGDAAAAAYPNKQKQWETDTRAQDQVIREEKDKDAQFTADAQIKWEEKATGKPVSDERKQAISAAARGMKLALPPKWGTKPISADDLAGQTDALGHVIQAGSGKVYQTVDQDGVRQYMPYLPPDSAQEKKVASLAKDIIQDQASHGVTVSPKDAEIAARSTILEQERRKTTDLPHFIMGEDENGNQVLKGVWGRSAPAPLNLPGNMKGPGGASGAGGANKSKSTKAPSDDGLVPAKFRNPPPNLTTGIPTGAPGKEKSALIVKADEEARRLGTVYEQAKGFLADPTDTNSQSLVMAYVRAQVAGAGRMTNTEIQNALKAGTWGTRLKNAWNQAVEGHLDKQFMTNMVGTIGISAKAARKMADKAKSKGGAGNVPLSMTAPGVSSPSAPKTAAEYLKSVMADGDK